MSKSILSETSWWPVNKLFTRKYGIDAALIIADLSSKQEYFKGRKMLDKNGYFFNEKKDIERDTSISPYRQDKAFKILTDIKVLDTEIRKGIPPKRYYRVNINRLNKLVLSLYELDGKNKKDTVNN